MALGQVVGGEGALDAGPDDDGVVGGPLGLAAGSHVCPRPRPRPHPRRQPGAEPRGGTGQSPAGTSGWWSFGCPPVPMGSGTTEPHIVLTPTAVLTPSPKALPEGPVPVGGINLTENKPPFPPDCGGMPVSITLPFVCQWETPHLLQGKLIFFFLRHNLLQP